MNYELKHKGFSLTEVLMAVGIFSVAMIFIAGAFPVAIHFTTIASEQTIAAVVADEAFAKIRLYGVNPSDANMQFNQQATFYNVRVTDINSDEFAYPSDSAVDKQYYWSAICRRIEGNDVQVTVFVSRKIGAGTMYWDVDLIGDLIETAVSPVPVRVGVAFAPSVRRDELLIVDRSNTDSAREEMFINNGCTIVDDATGHIYRVLERYSAPPDVVLLDRDWDAGSPNPTAVWVIPPPVNGGRYPCVGVFQKVIRF